MKGRVVEIKRRGEEEKDNIYIEREYRYLTFYDQTFGFGYWI